MIRRLAAFVLAFAVLVPVARGEEEPWKDDRRGVAIPVRDGKSLAADVLLPAKPGRYPAIVVQTPYDRAATRVALISADAAGAWDREHYAYVVVDWRGFFGSRAAGRARPGQRGEDGFDVVEWTAAQAWCDGKVGTWGPSALGRVQFDTAKERPPHLVCAVPVVAPMGQRYDDWYEGGVYREAHAEKLDVLGFGIGSTVFDRPLPDLPAWRLAAAAERPEEFDVPMFFITGWYDHATAHELDSFRAITARGGAKARDGTRLLVGPWNHMGIDLAEQGDLAFPAAAGEAALETRLFFDFHLRGMTTNGWAERPRVRTWRCNETGWFPTAAWPSTPFARGELFLHANGTIDARTPAADEPVRAYVDDPASPVPTVGGANLPAPGLTFGPRDQTSLLDRDDVLVYTTGPLAEPLRLDGVAALTVWLRTDRPDVDLHVRLCEVLADGRTMLVADGAQRAQLRRSPRREPLAPGEAVEVTVTLPPLAFTFPKDGRLRLVLAGSNWPRFERNPHTGELHFDPAKSVPAKVEILHDAAHPARLVMPLLPAVPEPATGAGK